MLASCVVRFTTCLSVSQEQEGPGDENSQKHHLQAREVVVINKSNIFCPHLPVVPRRSSRLPATWCWSRHSAGAETPLGDPVLRFTPDGKEPLSLFLAVLVSSVPPSR